MVTMAAASIDKATRSTILDAARAPVVAELNKPVLFRVQHLAASGDWAFLRAEMEGPDGRAIDYAGTPRADDARHGVISRAYVALLRRDGSSWRVVEHATGPTDVVWTDWATRHGAPAAIFG